MFKIYPNVERKTVTLVVAPTLFFGTKFLFEAYTGGARPRFFGQAVLDKAVNDELNTLVTELLGHLNEAAKALNLRPLIRKQVQDIEEGSFAPFRPRLDKDGLWDKKSYELALNAKKPGMFFKSLTGDEQVEEGNLRDYFFAVEVEFSLYADDYGETNLYSVFHRAIVSGKRGGGFTQQNDSAWDGFNFKEEVDEEVDEEDLPF